MHTAYGHLTYCSNIHSGESWEDHFAKLQAHVPAVKKQIAPDQSLGLGLRLADAASKKLQHPEALQAFKQWLQQENIYVFTMNGFPYGNFHHTHVKDQVHAPDWLHENRVDYTVRLAEILSQLLPDNMEGSISTSPLTYRYWHHPQDWPAVTEKATENLLTVVDALMQIRENTGRLIHIDIEPEPDGMLDNATEFVAWYQQYLLPMGINRLAHTRNTPAAQAEEIIKAHIQLCYDVCHFAVSYEDHAAMVKQLNELGIKTGKIQISAALKGRLNGSNQNQVVEAFKKFDEPVYLHQVVALQEDGKLVRYRDLSPAFADSHLQTKEWRAHFHVPIFIDRYEILQSTQEDIVTVLELQKNNRFTSYLEVETYTWEVLPDAIRLPMDQSISRELSWVLQVLHHHQQ